MGSISVIGAGSWGTAIGVLVSGKGLKVTLWARNSEFCDTLRKEKENKLYLPGVKFPKTLSVTSTLADALKGARIVVCCVPSHGIREVFKGAALMEGAIIVSASKGIEQKTHLTPSGILGSVLPKGFNERIAIISGPTFAKEVSMGLPSAACAAASSIIVAEEVQEVFSTPSFRVYTNTDTIGVELGGAMKNVIAIASGISDGLGLGSNARAALITRGLKEISVLGSAMGAKEATFYGLSGLGDLVLTCTGPLSRNYTLGLAIGRGRSLTDILGEMRMVAEGVKTSIAARELAEAKGVELPITEQVCKVLHEGKSPKQAVMELMTRGLKHEF